MHPILQRLKERKLVQWGLAYLAAAWVATEVVGSFAARWGIGLGVQQALDIFVACGFLVTVVLAWYHGEQGRQRIGGVELMIIAAVLTATGFAVSSLDVSEGLDEAPRRSLPWIAVLPLDNLSPNPDDAYFAAGLHDQVISQLGKLSGLVVISRSSVMQFADVRPSMGVIADQLGVDFVLEGSARRDDSRVRLTASLVDAGTDQMVWTEHYDRPLTAPSVIEIQEDLANRIAASLSATIRPEEGKRLAVLPTESIESYEHFLRGSQAQTRSLGRADLEEAVREYQMAVEDDDGFAAAHAMLSVAHGQMYWQQHDRSPDRKAKSWASARRAEAVAPDQAVVHLALGLHHYRDFDFGSALVELDRAIMLEPGNGDVIQARAAVRRRSGDWSGALEDFRLARALDPLTPQRVSELAATLTRTRRYDQALPVARRAQELNPEFSFPWVFVAVSYRGLGDPARALAETDDAPVAPWITLHRVEALMALGRFADALEESASFPDLWVAQNGFVPRELLQAMIYRLWEGPGSGSADTLATAALKELESEFVMDPSDHRINTSLGVVFALLGDRIKAIDHAARGIELLPLSRDALIGPNPLFGMAQVRALLGDDEAAVDRLTEVLAVPGMVSVETLRIDPTFAHLRDNPRFQALLRRHE